MAVLSPPLAEFFDMFFQFFLDYIMFAHNHPGKHNVKVNQQQQQTVDSLVSSLALFAFICIRQLFSVFLIA